MKEKLRYRVVSRFAKVASWVIFLFCTTLMLFRKKNKKDKT